MVKTFEIEQLDDIMKIWLETNIEAHKFIPKEYWTDNYEFVRTLLPQAEIFVNEDEGIIKGFIGITDKTYIAGLFVLEKYQSYGVGSQLIEKCKQDCLFLKLDVYSKNLKAVSFYKKHEFKIEQEKQNEDTNEKEFSMVWHSSRDDQ